MGLGLRYWTPGKIGLVSALGVIGLLAAVVGGQWLKGTPLENVFTLRDTTLAWWILGYGFVASVLPVWLLLAPRDYLSTFLKVGCVALLGVAIVLLAPHLKMPGLTRFIDGTGPVFAGPVFPFCFITIACGAISGFHSLVGSGTTPKLITRESDIRFVGYGAMIIEMIVGIMALVAASAMEPGQYFAINIKGDAAAVTQRVTELGFPVTTQQMADLAASVGEKSLIGRTGGAPTFAVGMAQMFAGVLGKHLLPLWYHFAIMFEALFILTTIDAGTRIGRFLVQDLLGYAWRPLGETRSMLGNWLASAAFVGAWGWFLYEGVIDPLGGINSLWPIFGVANQLLAVIALTLATTVLIKMGRTRYLWVTLAPLAWLLAVTMSAGWIKIFAADPKLGFLAQAHVLEAKLAAGGTAAQATEWGRQISNNYVNATVTGVFLVLVALVLAASARVWVALLTKHRAPDLHEEPAVALASLRNGTWAMAEAPAAAQNGSPTPADSAGLWLPLPPK